jgi:hypothetical protein
MTSPHDDHADKYNDPRVRITRKGLLIGVCVLLFGIGGSALSIWARRTRLEKSTEFWGPDVIQALQLAEEVELISMPRSSAAPIGTTAQTDTSTQPTPPPVRLSGMPGLGHLRHVLLDDRSYRWDSIRAESVSSLPAQSPCMMLRLTDPTANRFPEAGIVIDLERGWVGLQGGRRQVQLNERYQSAMPTFLKRIANYEPLRAEMREEKAKGGQ